MILISHLSFDSLQIDGVLTGSWSGFSDPESGIAYYEYYFGRSCVTAAQFCGSSNCVMADGSGACNPACSSPLNQSIQAHFRSTRGEFGCYVYMFYNTDSILLKSISFLRACFPLSRNVHKRDIPGHSFSWNVLLDGESDRLTLRMTESWCYKIMPARNKN